MKINVSVLIGCLLCVWMMAVLGVMYRAGEKQDGWRPSEVYSHVGTVSTSNASVVSSGSSDNVAVAMRSGRAVGSSRRVVPAPAFSYAHAGASNSRVLPISFGGNVSYSGVSYSPEGLYATSSATVKSFGAGSLMGVVVPSGAVRPASSQSFAEALAAQSTPTLLAYQQYGVNAQFVGDVYAGAQGVDLMAASQSMYDGMGNSMQDGMRGINGRRNLGEDMGSSYDSWLNWFNKFGWAYGSSDGNHYYYDDAQLRAAYAAWIATLSPQMPRPSYEEWLSWFASDEHYHEGGDKFFSFVPVGDIWPLIVLIMLYTLFIVIRKSFKTTCI